MAGRALAAIPCRFMQIHFSDGRGQAPQCNFASLAAAAFRDPAAEAGEVMQVVAHAPDEFNRILGDTVTGDRS
jgi:hypothetical protein